MNFFSIMFNRRQLVYLRDLLRELVVRDMKLRYKRPVLGMAWSILNPLAQLLVLRFVFGLVLPLKIPNYTTFLFTGLLAWHWFRSSLITATGSIVDNPGLNRRPGFPVAILPVITVITNLIHFLLAFPILLLFLILDGIQVTNTLLALPLVIIVQFIFILSIGYFVTTLQVAFRDTQYILGIFLLLGFYVSPIFYDVSSIPASYQLYYRLNPMVELIEAYRTILIKGQLPEQISLLILGLLSSCLLWVGYKIFMLKSHSFIEEL
jgi:lipopolysaccharide transport system permease protein